MKRILLSVAVLVAFSGVSAPGFEGCVCPRSPQVPMIYLEYVKDGNWQTLKSFRCHSPQDWECVRQCQEERRIHPWCQGGDSR